MRVNPSNPTRPKIQRSNLQTYTFTLKWTGLSSCSSFCIFPQCGKSQSEIFFKGAEECGKIGYLEKRMTRLETQNTNINSFYNQKNLYCFYDKYNRK